MFDFFDDDENLTYTDSKVYILAEKVNRGGGKHAECGSGVSFLLLLQLKNQLELGY